MKVTESTVRKLNISGVPNLDPVSVFLEDFGPGAGKVTITCAGSAWSNYWGAMGKDQQLTEFFCDCDEHYLARKLQTGIKHLIDDPDSDRLESFLKSEIIKSRKDGDLNKKTARDLWIHAEGVDAEHPGESREVLCQILGDEWWDCLPKTPNPDYEYLCQIIKTIQAALKEKKQ